MLWLQNLDFAGGVGAGGSDDTPDAFSFTDQTGVNILSTVTSNAITVAGIDTASAISITGGEYSVNGGAWTSSPGTVVNADTVEVRHTSSASYETATNTALTIGGVSDTFTSTTGVEPAPGEGNVIPILRRRGRR
jgi:hypothetical protein